MSATLTAPAFYVRWMIRRDTVEVLAIEQAAASRPWNEAQLVARLRQSNHIGMVAEDRQGKVVAFMTYRLHRHTIRLTRFAVDPACGLEGVAIAMLDQLYSKLQSHRRTRIAYRLPSADPESFALFTRFGFVVDEDLPEHDRQMLAELPAEVAWDYLLDLGIDSPRLAFSI